MVVEGSVCLGDSVTSQTVTGTTMSRATAATRRMGVSREVGCESPTSRKGRETWGTQRHTQPRNPTTSLTKRWQLDQIVFWNRFQRLAGLAPGGEAADDHERVEAFFLQ